MAGASVSKVLLVCQHHGLKVYGVRTYFYHKKNYLFAAVVKHWKNYRSLLIESLKLKNALTWCEDGRFDSMGHCAKYGVYIMFCSDIDKCTCVHFELIQVWYIQKDKLLRCSLLLNRDRSLDVNGT